MYLNRHQEDIQHTAKPKDTTFIHENRESTKILQKEAYFPKSFNSKTPKQREIAGTSVFCRNIEDSREFFHASSTIFIHHVYNIFFLSKNWLFFVLPSLKNTFAF